METDYTMTPDQDPAARNGEPVQKQGPLPPERAPQQPLDMVPSSNDDTIAGDETQGFIAATSTKNVFQDVSASTTQPNDDPLALSEKTLGELSQWIVDLVTQAAETQQPDLLYAPDVLTSLATLGATDPDRWAAIDGATKALKDLQKQLSPHWNAWKQLLTKRIKQQVAYNTQVAQQQALRHDLTQLYQDGPLLKHQGWEAIEARWTTLISIHGADAVLMQDDKLHGLFHEVFSALPDQVRAWVQHLITQGQWTKTKAQKWFKMIARPMRAVSFQDADPTTEPSTITIGAIWGNELDPIMQAWPLPTPEQGWVVHPQGIAKPGTIGFDGTQELYPILYMPVLITGLGHDATDTASLVRLTWRTMHGWMHRWIPRKTIMMVNKVGETLADLDIDFAPNQTKYLPDWFQDQQNAIGRNTLPEFIVIKHCGWLRLHNGNTWVFLFPDTDYTIGTTNISVVSQVQQEVAEMYTVAGTLQEEADIMADAMHLEPQLAWAVGHAAASIWLRRLNALGLMDVRGYGVEVVSDKTGQGKTFAVRVALMPWQKPDPRLADFSNAGAISWLAESNDLPHGIQETQDFQAGVNASYNAANWVTIVQGLSDNGGSIRGTAEGGVKIPPSLAGVLLFANNQSIIGGASVNGGGQVRILSTGTLFAMHNDQVRTAVEQLEQRMARSYGHAGRLVVERVAVLTDTEVQHAWDPAYQEVLARIEQMLPSNIPDEIRKIAYRQAKMWTAGLLGLRTLFQWGYQWSVDQLPLIESGYWRIATKLAENFTDTYLPEWQRWWNILASFLRQHAQEFAGLEAEAYTADGTKKIMPKEYRGRYFPEKNLLAIEHGWLEDVLHKQGRIDIKTLKKAWVREGLLIPEVDKNGQFTRFERNIRMRRSDGQSYQTRATCFRADAVGFSVADDDENDMDVPIESAESFREDSVQPITTTFSDQESDTSWKQNIDRQIEDLFKNGPLDTI